jgi:hypothetical protein
MNPTRSGNFLNAGGTPRSVGALYPDPWVTISSTTDPQTIPHLLLMAERLLRHNPLLARAYRRVIAFLITKVNVKDCADEEKKKYIEFLYQRVRIVSTLHAAAYDYMSVGNYFGSLQSPFTRYLMCKSCNNYQAPIDQVPYRFENFKFFAKCPMCSRSGEWHRWEVYNQDQKQMHVKRWSPHEMEIKYIESTDERIYFWKLNPTIRAAIKKGDPDYLRNTPWVVIECVQNNSWLKFGKDQIIHLYNEPPAGWRTGGWGIPDCLQLKPELYQLQLCRRHNEAICHEGIIPMKFLSPQAVSKIGVPGAPNIMDPSIATSLSGNFITSLHQALSRRRNDPYGIHVLPHGVNFQQIGGDAKNLVPKDITDQNVDYVLNAAGIPVNFYKADFTTQGAPMALRAVQSSWSHLVDNLDRLIDFIMTHSSRILQIEPATGSLAKPSDIDDINRIMAGLNLMSSGAVSPETGLGLIGLDSEEEMDRSMYNQIQQAKKQKEMQKTIDREGLTDMMNQGMAPAPAGQQQGGQQQGGQPQPQQGGPPPITADPQLPKTPQDVTMEAQAWAAYLLPLSVQNRQAYMQYLLQLRQKDHNLHQIVMGMMEDQRQQLGNQGRDMLLGGQQPQ